MLEGFELYSGRFFSLWGSKKVLAKRMDLASFLLINEGDFPNRKNDMADSSGTLNACADYTRRGVAAAPDHDADHAAREGRVVAEQKRLIRWAEENGRLKTRHRSLPEFARGGEHLVFYRQSNQRYYKATLSERQKGYGIALGSFSRGATPRLQGLRKVRMALQGRSRSGGARVIYLYLPQHHTIIFFYGYTQAKLENLTPDQEKRLRAAVEIIKREFRHENQRY